MAATGYVPAPRAPGGNYQMDDDTDKVQRRAPSIRRDLVIIEDFCVNQWSIHEMVTHYNHSKTALVKTGLLLATQLYDLVACVKIRMDQQESEDHIKFLAAFWKDTPIDAICRNAKVSMDKLLEIGFGLAHKFYTAIKAAGLKEQLIVECLAYNSRGYGMDMATAFERTMSNKKQMRLQMKKDVLDMFGMEAALKRW